MSDAGTFTILLVEDNLHDRMLLEESFELAGHLDVRVDWLGSGLDVIDLFQKKEDSTATRLHLLLMDAFLPGSSAEDVLREVGTAISERQIPIVVLTSVATDAQRARLAGLGVREVLVKPLELDGYIDLAHRIYGMLTGRSS